MSKIGIATITILVDNENAYNYGNKLQMYAMQEYLRTLGHDCCTILYKFTPSEYEMLPSKVKEEKSFMQLIDDVIRVVSRKIKRKKLSIMRNERKTKFDNFVEKNIVLTKEIYTRESNFDALAQLYDYFITGSDQVWNPYCEGSNEFYYLTFAPEAKRIAYAPSIAVDALPSKCIENYKKWVNGIPYLSVREDVGQRVLQQLTDKDVLLVCDPVFLLTREQWGKLAKKPKTHDKYFVSYFLGKKTVETKNKLKRLEKMTNMKCIDVYTRDSINSYFAGPEEFLGLIQNAEFICTDSFHGTAFATIFSVPMIIFERNGTTKMNSRIDSLLRLIDCNNRSINDILSGKSTIDIPQFDKYKKHEKIIFESKKYIERALNGGTV